MVQGRRKGSRGGALKKRRIYLLKGPILGLLGKALVKAKLLAILEGPLRVFALLVTSIICCRREIPTVVEVRRVIEMQPPRGVEGISRSRRDEVDLIFEKVMTWRSQNIRKDARHGEGGEEWRMRGGRGERGRE